MVLDRRSYVAASLLILVACAGTPVAPVSTAQVITADEATSENAPGWARKGDEEDDTGYRFICEGQGSAEADAVATARAICEDKICKLCGVEIESVLKTQETLDGVDFKRVVIERCKRVQQEALTIARKSTDCGPNGCTSWMQVNYTKETKKKECARLTDDNFADPDQCAKNIESLVGIAGFSSESFVQRTAALDAAIDSCADIDVRPTPLLQSLDTKLRSGMGHWRSARIPRFIRFWLKDDPALWKAYAEDGTFVGRIKRLRAYVAHKVKVMTFIEAVMDDALLTDAGQKRLLRAMEGLSKEQRFGVGRFHFPAAFELGKNTRTYKTTQSLEPIGAFMRRTYAANTLLRQESSDLARMFAADQVVTEEEWKYIQDSKYWRSGALVLLGVEEHRGGTRFTRLMAAYKKRRAEEAERGRQNAVKAFLAVMPFNAKFLKAVHARLPKELREAFDYDVYYQFFSRTDEWQVKLRSWVGQHMLDALARERSAPERAGARSCLGLSKKILQVLDADVGLTRFGSLAKPVCSCLEAMSDDGTHTLTNKTELYTIAVKEGWACVQ